MEDIISTRETEPFKDISAIYQLMGSAMQDEYSKILPYIDVKSSLFYIKLELNIGYEYMQAQPKSAAVMILHCMVHCLNQNAHLLGQMSLILVTVLIIIAACTTLVLFIHEKTMNAYGTVISLQNDYQGAVYAMTAVEALEMAFKYDEETYDSSSDIWAQIPPIPLDNGFMTVYIKPLNAKVPLAGLVSSDEKLKERTENAVTTLLSELELTESNIYDLNRLL